jgi:hypothetical protein
MAGRSHRDRMPGPGELPPLRAILCRTREPGDNDTTGLRTLTGHAFYCHTELACLRCLAAEATKQHTPAVHLPSYR